MDEEDDPNNEDVNFVLAQESSKLLQIISSQSPSIIMTLSEMIPRDAGWNLDQHSLSTSSAAEVMKHIAAMLEYFKKAEAAVCCNFLQSVCMLCENVPMALESKLMSVAGNATNNENFVDEVPEEKSSSPPSEPLFVKRPRIAHWEKYIAAVMNLLLRRWERLRERLVTEVQLGNVWVSPRTANRCRDKPDQTPVSADRGSRTPEPDGDYGAMEARVTLESFLQGCTGKVTVLLGQAGSGKTLLMSCLGQQWAHGLGPIPSSHLFILLEFHQLNLLSRPLSLFQLLFHHYLPLHGGRDEKRDILDYLHSNPEQICFVLDGYDEFHSRITREEVPKEPLDPEKALPVAQLVSGLLNRQLLPGCTVVITCRLRDVSDLEGISDKAGQLLSWDCHAIEEYVNNFFGVKGLQGNRALGMQAANLLLSSPHLVAMSTLPALCNICCICVEYLLQEGKEETLRFGVGEEDEGSETKTCETEKGLKEGVSLGGIGGEESEDKMMDWTNDKPLTQPQIPATRTQIYLAVLCAFLSRDHDKERRNVEAKTARLPQGTLSTALHQYRSEVCELSRLAQRGLERSQILFLEEDIPQDILEFSLRIGLFSQVELRKEDGNLVSAFSFIHLTVQEFLAALNIMTSDDVSDTQLRKRFSLKTRWMTKSDQKTVFTESLHLHICGLASSHCTQALVQLAGTSLGTGSLSLVQRRQALILTVLKNLSNSNTLTGPKILELCHCVQETQNYTLSKEVMGTRRTLELRNIWLLPNDFEALAFVANSVGDSGFGLDFRSCSMDLECIDVLCRCQYIRSLSFRGRRYCDKFAEKLSSILPGCKYLRKLEFCGASLTATGAAMLASALHKCPDIAEINLTDNLLKNEGIKKVVDILIHLPNLDSVIGKKHVTVFCSRNSGSNIHIRKSEPSISLLNQKWSKSEMQRFTNSLAGFPDLSVLDLSGSQWDVKTLRKLTQTLSKFHIAQKIIMNDSCSSVEALLTLTALISDCPAVMELQIRLQSPAQVSIVFSGGSQPSANEISKTLCVSCSGLLPADAERVWNGLGISSNLTVLDLSRNCLGNKGLKKLLDVLPHLTNIQRIDASNNGVNLEGVVMLAEALCSHNNLTQLHISEGGSDQVILKFCPEKSEKHQVKLIRICNSNLLPSDVALLCRKLVQCHYHLELHLLESSLKDKAIENLLKALPRMGSLQKLNVSHSITSITGALTLLSCLTDCQRVSSVELSPQGESFIHFEDVEPMQASCRLTHFSLNIDNVERLLGILQQASPLSYLDISNNQLEDKGVKCLVDCLLKLQITRYVNLSNNGMTQQGLLDVASTLSACSNISGVEVSLGADERCLIWFRKYESCEKTLSIRDSSLENEHLLRLSNIVANCFSPCKLQLKNNSLMLKQIEYFVKLLNGSQSGCTVSVEEGWITSVEAVSLVCQCLDLNSNIQTVGVHHTTLHLSLRKSADLTSASSTSADPAPSMATEKIGLMECAAEGSQIATMRSILQRCPSLTELDFSHNKLGLEGAEFLCSILPSLPNLTLLSVASKEARLTEELAEALLQASTIRSLNLSGHVIEDKTAEIMTKMLGRLQSVNLSHCVWSVTGGLQIVNALAQCVHLECLCLDSVCLVEDSRVSLAHVLRRLHSLHSLKLNEISTGTGPSEMSGALDLLVAMEGLTQMQEIELKDWRMADQGIEQLTRLLPVWTKLRKISLSNNLISDPSGEKLLEALGSCSYLEELHLSNNSLGDGTSTRMALILPSLTCLSVLDISQNKIGCEGSVNLSKAILGMKNLSKINLTSVGTSDLCAIIASLSSCPLIQDVSLGWNHCGDEVALELARVLPFCERLTRLDLESNRVSVVGAEVLGRALQSCPALELIRLWRNKLSSSEAQRMSLRDRRLNFSST
ncbi:protein NLRC5 [Aulostomus maculatus]